MILANLLERAATPSSGARQVVGGEPEGLVLPPHVFAEATNEMAIAREELFGPVVPVIKVRGDQEALEVANATSYPGRTQNSLM